MDNTAYDTTIDSNINKDALANKLDYKVYYAIPKTKDFNDDLKLVKLLKLQNYSTHNTNNTNYMLKDEIQTKTLVLIDKYKRIKDSKEKSNILKKLRKIDSIYKLPDKLKDTFNNYKFKDKKVREI